MAQENIASVVPLFHESIGGRTLAIGEAVLPSKYKTEGCQFSNTQLEQLGLPDALVDCGWCITAGLAAKNVEQIICQLNITNPGPTKNEGQITAIQCYESITTALNKELAAESTKISAGKVLVALIGR